MRSGDAGNYISGAPGQELIPRTLPMEVAFLDTSWFKQRNYKHFDHRVGVDFVLKAMKASYVSEHSFSPLIHYTKKIKRYSKKDNKTIIKERPIMYASHKDSCILGYYSKLLNDALNTFYIDNDLDNEVIAYRALQKGNYDFSAEAHRFATESQPVTIMAFDVTGFFDNLNHILLKRRLKTLLLVDSLPLDWYKVLSYLTKYHFTKLEELRAVPKFAKRMECSTAKMIAPIREVIASGVEFYPNAKPGVGIPQGTPISAALSNAYMIDFDTNVKQYCESIGAFYRRYSDDILIICQPKYASDARRKVENFIKQEKLKLSERKTEISNFPHSKHAKAGNRAAQYLGFTLDPSGASIRPGSLSRQWRKMRWSIRRAGTIASEAIAEGKSEKVYTKTLRRRFSSLTGRNFSSYARRSAQAFTNDKTIKRQIRRFERGFEKELAKLKRRIDK